MSTVRSIAAFWPYPELEGKNEDYGRAGDQQAQVLRAEEVVGDFLNWSLTDGLFLF